MRCTERSTRLLTVISTWSCYLDSALACDSSATAHSLHDGAASSGGTTECRLTKLYDNEEQNLGTHTLGKSCCRN
jgi:hypothetical protein